tara:strand:- start:138 stop:377 length:240 start_codon:yes stop_codon:yes gene_type:complete
MNSNTETNIDNQLIDKEKTDSEIPTLSTSATTNDVPEFGWSGYAERINGRFAMIGLIAVLLVEAFSKISFLEWAGIMSK